MPQIKCPWDRLTGMLPSYDGLKEQVQVDGYGKGQEALFWAFLAWLAGKPVTLGEGTPDFLQLKEEFNTTCEDGPQICSWGVCWPTWQPITSSHFSMECLLPPASTLENGQRENEET